MVKIQIENVESFARIIHDMLRSDRDVNVGVAGFTGEGKSTFSTLLQKKYSEISNTDWSFSNMTWSRTEMMTWIDGEKGSQKDASTGLKKGQVPEYSAILPDELFSMFYRRNWFDEDQIDAISTFNMCRDRHLLVCGNVPNFWELDGGFTSRIRFYVYIPYRGVAWVFEQENNPFAKDQWNQSENLKMFRKNKSPYKCPNFLMEIHYSDWDPEEKEEYYKIRNQKRLDVSMKKGKSVPAQDQFDKIKMQRDNAIKMFYAKCPDEPLTVMQEATGLSHTHIRRVRYGLK